MIATFWKRSPNFQFKKGFFGGDGGGSRKGICAPEDKLFSPPPLNLFSSMAQLLEVQSVGPSSYTGKTDKP